MTDFYSITNRTHSQPLVFICY